MLGLRIVLFVFVLLLLASAPFAMKLTWRNDQRDFDLAVKEYIALNGSSEGLYGDCSGTSFLMPVAGVAYGFGFAVYAFVTALLAKAQGRVAVLSQTIVIGIVGVLPMLLWLLRELQRM